MATTATLSLSVDGIAHAVTVSVERVGVEVLGWCDFFYVLTVDGETRYGRLKKQWVPHALDELRVVARVLQREFPFAQANTYAAAPMLDSLPTTRVTDARK